MSEFGSVLLKNGGEKELARDMAEPDAEPTVKSTKEVVSKADAVPDGRGSGGAEEGKARGNLWWLLLLLIALTCGRIAWNARKKKNKHDE